jgi:hypothetical protein
MQYSEKTFTNIENYELSKKNQYDIETLEFNIGNLSLRKLLQTQVLTPEFCIKYILEPEEHGMCIEDYYFCDFDILKYQTHITKEQLMDARQNLNK